MFFTYSEFEQYRNSMGNDSALKWLPEFESWLSQYYDVEFMPSSYEHVTTRGMQLHNIRLIVMNKRDKTKVLPNLPNSWQYLREFLTEKANEYALSYGEPIMYDEDCLRVVDLISFEDAYLLLYLCSQLPFELKEEIKSLFGPYNPTYICHDMPIICVLKTKKEARNFLLSEDIKRIKKQIYDLLKTYDEYDVLKEKDISIVVDYEKHKNSISMYSRYIHDMSKEDLENYENQIING